MIVLDTNVVSELQRPHPHALVEQWLASTGIESTFICGPILMEQAFGAELHFLKSGSRRYIETLDKLRNEYANRSLTLDVIASELAGRLRARRENRGRPLSIGDAMIAAICLVHDATLATRNVRDFDGLDLKLVNPFEAGA
jgi:predicted nucleic acid-binding protein